MMAISAELLVGMLALPAIAATSSLPAHAAAAAAAIENKRLGSENEIAGLVGGIRDQEKEIRIGPCDLRIRERAWRREGNPARNRSIDPTALFRGVDGSAGLIRSVSIFRFRLPASSDDN
jgi:hypothetical protein